MVQHALQIWNEIAQFDRSLIMDCKVIIAYHVCTRHKYTHLYFLLTLNVLA